jgi:serralysin
VLNGGAGIDTLSGGLGADRFVLGSLTDTGTTNADADYIRDFSFAGGDRLDLRRIDANEGQSGNQAFTFIGTASFTAAGQVNFSVSAGDTFLALNTDADTDAEAVIHIEQLGVNANWFLL